MPKIEIHGIEALAKGIKSNIPMSLVKEVVAGNGAEMKNKMIANADFKQGYQTGTTKRSITMDITDGGLTAEVEPTTEYSPYLEYGTRFMDAQPFVKPAFEDQARQFKKDMEKLVR